MSEKLSRTKFYELADRIPFPEMVAMGLTTRLNQLFPRDAEGNLVYAQWDGKPPRHPKKGEWYLSGAIIEAYRAPNDLTTKYHIAQLVSAKEVREMVKVLDIPKYEQKPVDEED